MKKYFISAAVCLLFVCAVVIGIRVSAQTESVGNALPSPNLVISQVQMGGAANANDEFIEIHNNGADPVDLLNHRVVYRSASGTNDVGPMAVWATSTIIQPGQYMLIAATSYDGGISPDKVYDPTVCACSMSATGGGVAIRFGDSNTGTVLDSVAWGSATNIFIEGTTTPAPGNDNSKARALNGCQDSDNNSADFATLTPAAARNTSTTPVTCSGGGTTLFGALVAAPTSGNPGSTTLLVMTVIPATTPPSTGITVTGNLTQIGGSATQTFFDNGTNGDVTPGDNKFSYLATVDAATAPGLKQLSATATDAQARNVISNASFTVNGTLPNEDPLILGNPSGATANIANENNYLMVKGAYSMSYNRSRNIPNWSAWRLDSSWIGSANSGNFAPDTSLPAGWYQVTPTDYSEPIYDRGHMCPSGDRTITQPINDQTYLMTNIIPQLPANNQGPWVDFELYCRTLAAQGNEIYIFSGGVGNHTTIGASQDPDKRVVVPTLTWKVVLVMPNGNDDLTRASVRSTRAFGVIMSNVSITQASPWRNYRTTVDAVEYLTGYDFFNQIPKNTQEIIERRRDRL
ncbi:MAG: DNA/RNA non-specific endonuclease [Pyrinomonadaceae bacterium]|nr:DNA/RNA non-specific endonuclease [Acidobacteriota bacterium]MBK7932592.1 DNA/RNA non-specific endonuclease [Acidobacteriota bacterium]MBP7376081.1 DNA/RNA non-specific endonuclease [Pyrinomonadaceae bacterium]